MGLKKHLHCLGSVVALKCTEVLRSMLLEEQLADAFYVK
jgi:hypothetical protein